MDGRYLEFHKCLSNSNYQINVALVEDLNKIDAVRHLIIQNRLGVTLINATMIMDTFQLLVAVNKAVNARTKGSMTTKTIHSEILYSLSPSNSISGSLKQFGLSDTVKAYYIVEVIPSDECSKIESVFQIIDGRLSDVHSSRHAHVDEIRKVYKVSEEELLESSLLDAVVNRIACKDCM